MGTLKAHLRGWDCRDRYLGVHPKVSDAGAAGDRERADPTESS